MVGQENDPASYWETFQGVFLAVKLRVVNYMVEPPCLKKRVKTWQKNIPQEVHQSAETQIAIFIAGDTCFPDHRLWLWYLYACLVFGEKQLKNKPK